MRRLQFVLLATLVAGLPLLAGPVAAQPIIIPLQHQDKPQAPGPMASAPPVAPPQVAPSIPDTGIARGPDATQQEEAYQPADGAPPAVPR